MEETGNGFCKTEIRGVLHQLLHLGGGQQGNLLGKSEHVRETGEQSIIYISGKTAPLLNNLPQAVQEKGKRIAPISQMDKLSKIKHLAQIQHLSRVHTFTRNQTCPCLHMSTVQGRCF